MELSKTIHIDPEIMGGEPVFVGMRVPVKTLFDHLAAGDSLEVFLDDFPSLKAAGARMPHVVGTTSSGCGKFA